MTSRRRKISPKSGRGLGHVTPIIFGSTVGYPSDSYWFLVIIGTFVITGGVARNLRQGRFFIKSADDFRIQAVATNSDSISHCKLFHVRVPMPKNCDVKLTGSDVRHWLKI